MSDAATLQFLAECGATVAALNAEHTIIDRALRRLDQAISSGAGEATIAGFLEECIEFCQAHFTNEERFMRDYGHRQYDAHRSEHQRLLDCFMKVRASAAGEGVTIATLDGVDLLHEFQRHVEAYDRIMFDEIEFGR